jgi:hypothetical protein
MNDNNTIRLANLGILVVTASLPRINDIVPMQFVEAQQRGFNLTTDMYNELYLY